LNSRSRGASKSRVRTKGFEVESAIAFTTCS
jgi:hypothetical protein